MEHPCGGGRRRSIMYQYSTEDQVFDEIAKDAEARNTALWQARNEAREIRCQELEKQQQKDAEETESSYEFPNNRSTKHFASSRGHLHTSNASSYTSSRRNSEDSSESDHLGTSVKDLKHEIKVLEEKFKNTMINNVQLENEKSALSYQVSMFKDQIMELEETLELCKRESSNRKRDLELGKHRNRELETENTLLRHETSELLELLKQNGLVIMGVEEEGTEGQIVWKKILVSENSARMLEESEGTLETKLKRLAELKNDLEDRIRRLKLDLEEEKSKSLRISKGSSSSLPNGPEIDMLEIQRETNRIVADSRFRLQKVEQELAASQALTTRLEGQISRFKSQAEAAEKNEENLKVERRKLQRELREAQSRIEELETCKSHLEKRLDKLKNARSTLLKEL